jgi:hypothetical protein
MARSSHLIDSSIQYSWRSGSVRAFSRHVEARVIHAALRSMAHPHLVAGRVMSATYREAPVLNFARRLSCARKHISAFKRLSVR